MPFEQLRKSARTSQKYIEKELTTLSTNVADLASKTSNGVADPAQAHKSLDAMLERLQKLKRKLEETKQEELVYVNRTKKRLEHLQDLSEIQEMGSDAYQKWSKVRLDRMLVDYMLRNGFPATAERLSKDADVQVRWKPGDRCRLCALF